MALKRRYNDGCEVNGNTAALELSRGIMRCFFGHKVKALLSPVRARPGDGTDGWCGRAPVAKKGILGSGTERYRMARQETGVCSMNMSLEESTQGHTNFSPARLLTPFRPTCGFRCTLGDAVVGKYVDVFRAHSVSATHDECCAR